MMPRLRRIAVPHYPHHLIQRGHNRETVFRSPADFRAYLQILEDLRELLGIRVYGYCLMTNHVHLIVAPGDEASALSVLMKKLASRHTRRINNLTRRTGTAWEGRFKCSPIETDRYLLACSRYVDLNPVRAGMARKPEDYPWSSFRAKVGLAECEWLDSDPAYASLAVDPERRRARYREFVEQGVERSELELIRTAIQRNRLTGSDEFVERFAESTGLFAPSRAPGRPPR